MNGREAPRVIVVEDVPDLCEDLCIHLSDAGFRVVGVADGAGLDAALAQAPAELLVLDLGLPGESGVQIATRLRASHPRLGIVMLTGRSLLPDRIAGHAAGADAYLVKPVHMAELVLVLRNLAARLQPPPASPPPWQLDVRAMRLRHPGGVVLALTGAETHLMHTLAAATAQRAGRRALVQALGYRWDTYDERRLEAIVSRLRRKLVGQLGLADSPLRSLRGEGYAFVEPLVLADP